MENKSQTKSYARVLRGSGGVAGHEQSTRGRDGNGVELPKYPQY